MKQIIFGVLCCSLLGYSYTAIARDLTSREQKIIIDVINAQLRDPTGAKYFWRDYKDGNIYCAYVNARIPYGGYGGKTPIIMVVSRDKNGQINKATGLVSNDSMFPLCCTEACHNF